MPTSAVPVAGTGGRGFVRSRGGHGRGGMRSGVGFTLLELMFAIAVVAILGVIAQGQVSAYIERARIGQASADIATMGVEVIRFQSVSGGALPATLADIGRERHLDPWGRTYHYTNLTTTNKGAARKDRRLNPLNSDFDLFSAGKDGVYKPQVSQKDSLDDVIRARDGSYIGVARDF